MIQMQQHVKINIMQCNIYTRICKYHLVWWDD